MLLFPITEKSAKSIPILCINMSAHYYRREEKNGGKTLDQMGSDEDMLTMNK